MKIKSSKSLIMNCLNTIRGIYVVKLVLLTLVCGVSMPVNALAQTDEENLVSVKALVTPDRVSPRAEAMLKLELKLVAGAHANSNRVTDPNLIPTVFLPQSQAGLIWGQPAYPEPTEVIEWYSTEPLSVFEDGAVISVPLTIEKTAVPGQMMVEGSLRIQVCDSEKCYPPRRIPVKVPLSIVKENNTKSENSTAHVASKTDPIDQTVKTNSPGDKQPADASGLDFTFVDFNGKERKFSEFRGKYVLLDFWATWCAPCLADIPKLKELYAKFKDKNFEIIGMDAETIGDEQDAPDPEFAKETQERAKQIVTARGVSWTQATSETAVPVAVKVFNVKALPTKILIDPEGKIIAMIGEKDDLTGIVEKLVSGKR